MHSFLADDSRQDKIRVNEVFKDNQWHWDCLHTQPPDFVKNIISSMQLTLSPDEDDLAIWSPTASGKFSLASAWNMLRQKKEVSFLDSKIWHRDVPFKMAFLTWRAVHDKLPTDERVSRFGHSLSPKCYCCVDSTVNSSLESVEHLFCSGVFAQLVWEHQLLNATS